MPNYGMGCHRPRRGSPGASQGSHKHKLGKGGLKNSPPGTAKNYQKTTVNTDMHTCDARKDSSLEDGWSTTMDT